METRKSVGRTVRTLTGAISLFALVLCSGACAQTPRDLIESEEAIPLVRAQSPPESVPRLFAASTNEQVPARWSTGQLVYEEWPDASGSFSSTELPLSEVVGGAVPGTSDQLTVALGASELPSYLEIRLSSHDPRGNDQGIANAIYICKVPPSAADADICADLDRTQQIDGQDSRALTVPIGLGTEWVVVYAAWADVRSDGSYREHSAAWLLSIERD